MRKKSRFFSLLLMFASVISFSGCDNNKTENYEFQNISEIRDNFSRLSDELRQMEFSNLDFSKADFSFPPIDSISELTLAPFSGKNEKEIYDFFCENIDTLMPHVYSDEQKMYEVRFADGERNGETGTFYDFPSINEYKLTDNPWPNILTDECFIDMQRGVMRWFDNGALMRYCGETEQPAMKMMIAENRRAEMFITDMSCTDKYELINGELSVKDAADFVNNYCKTMHLSLYEQSAVKKAVAVNVVNIGGGKYGYNFIVAPEYKNVLFDYAEMEKTNGIRTVKNDYDSRIYDVLPGQIDMIEQGKIHHFVSPAYPFSIEENAVYTSVISMKSAAEIISDFFSQSIKFTVKRVQAVYLPYGNTASPCWKFLLKTGNDYYHTFVNMQTEEVYVYIQEI